MPDPKHYKRLPGMKLLPDETSPILIFGPASQIRKAISHDVNLLEEEELGTSQIITSDHIGKIIQVKLTQPISEVRKALLRFANPIERKQIIDFNAITDKEWNRLFDPPHHDKEKDA